MSELRTLAKGFNVQSLKIQTASGAFYWKGGKWAVRDENVHNLQG